VLGFGLSLYLVFELNAGIPALVTGLAVVDGLALLLLGLWNPVGIRWDVRGIRGKDLRDLLSYGMAGLIMNMSLLTLNLSDRYVILWSEGLSSVGIYDQVYKISQLSVSALIAVFFNTVNPGLFRKLEENLEGSLSTLAAYLKMFLLLGLPLVVYLSLFSELISDLLLGPSFRGAYRIMPFVFFAAFLQGISNFYELRMKFSDQLRRLGLVFLVAALFNLVLNLLLVPGHGYYWAAVSTFLTFLGVVLYFAWTDRHLLSSLKMHDGKFPGLAGLLLLQALVFIVVDNFDPSVPVVFAMGLIFVILYAGLLYRSGALKELTEE
jgi:O-antigen/teichoic acid export membrane protein